MRKVTFSLLLFLVLICSCDSDSGTMEPEPILAQNMSIAIAMEREYESYDTQVTVFSLGEQRVSVNEGVYKDAVIQYDLSQDVEHVFSFDEKVVSVGIRIALGQLKEGMITTDSAIINISAYIDNELFDNQLLVTKPDSERDTIGYIYNALGQLFIEFDTRK